jgi:tRNA A-37 threonylcarbamoyl transferase component Bud32/tetratricopeptide (TPR) repeat protein
VNADCLDDGVVLAFLEGALSQNDRSQVEGHVAACTACADLMTWAAADQAHPSRTVGREGRPFVGQLHPGSRVDRYQILGAVGRGGMGEVYAAYHPDLDRRIALKVVHELGAESLERRARLLREARAIARLSHPNVISVYDAGTVADRVYIAMEFVDGETVDAWLRSQSRSWREVVDVFIAAGRGLAAAHAAGIVHRDFKPQNVMIGRDGAVRVMDFGLARLAEEPPDLAAGSVVPPVALTVTKTGAVVGTPAYMAPEQFRGEAIDERADQFSFCVALHEALFGQRPRLRHVERAEGTAASPTSSVPSWLRAAVSRGMADAREQRFSSMDELIRVLVRGRARPRRHALGVGVSVAIILVAIGGWRVARGGRIHCEIPTARLDAAWSRLDDSRRQAIHRAFTASGRATAETSWQRVSKALDDYVGPWSAMYIDACEATHVRGEQSAEVLDVRMSCLAENLDEVRALANVLSTADADATSNAVAAVQSLTPIGRCADVAALRSAVPLPRDAPTLQKVRELRASLKEAQALRDLTSFPAALKRATALRPQVEATGYGPLRAELLELIGCTQDRANTEATLHEALFIAEASRDDATAAKVAADLVVVGAYRPDRLPEAEVWFHLSESILDRLGGEHERIRGWALNNLAMAVAHSGDFKRAQQLLRKAVAAKERELGRDHPDVAISLTNLAAVLSEDGDPAGAIEMATRAIDIVSRAGNPDSERVATARNSLATSLIALGRYSDAQATFSSELARFRQRDPADPNAAWPLQGLGALRLAMHRSDAAVSVLEEALRLREAHEPFEYNVAETEYSLARALWDSGRDRKRAITLAMRARKSYVEHFPRHEHAVADWLATHKLPRR